MEKSISRQTMRRLPAYLHYLKYVAGTKETISATALASAFGLNDVQVRKDLGSVSGSGRPKTGYIIEELISQIENMLGCGSVTKTVLIGAGHLGSALLAYDGFSDYGLTISAAFDTDTEKHGTVIHGKPVLPMEKLQEVCRESKINLAILTVPIEAAQEVCNCLVECGVRAIWNFAPTILRVPKGIKVENENLASSLAILSNHLSSQDKK